VAFERISDPAKMRLEDLPPSLRSSPEFTALMKEFSRALAKGGKDGAKALADPAPRFNAMYALLQYSRGRSTSTRPSTRISKRPSRTSSTRWRDCGRNWRAPGRVRRGGEPDDGLAGDMIRV
jgi:hypothetical protein